MAQQLTEGFTEQQLADMRALCKNGVKTGKTFSYDPATRQVDAYRPGILTPVETFTMSTTPAPTFRAPRAIARPRATRRSSSKSTRGPPGDDEPPSDLVVIPPATFGWELDRAVKARALLRWSRSLDGARPLDRAYIRGLSDEELVDHVRGLNQVDRAVKRYRGAA